jgi:hypothetical protein
MNVASSIFAKLSTAGLIAAVSTTKTITKKG